MTDAKDIKGRIAHTDRRLAHLNRVTQALRTLQARRRRLLTVLSSGDKPAVMYDSITLDQIPLNAPAVAGYVGGKWPTYAKLAGRWPRAKHLSIAVASGQNAECLDVEPGDATNQTAPAWVRRQLSRGVRRPVLYTSVSNIQALLTSLAAHGISRGDVRIWSAHYTFKPHLCGPSCGYGVRTVADATQWTDKALGKNLDESLCSKGFWS